MKILPLTLVGAALSVAGCSSSPNPWIAEQRHAADATVGVRSLLRSHYAIDESCNAKPRPAIAVTTAPKLGTVSVQETVASVVAPGTECDGRSVQATGVYYEAAVGAIGIDTVSYIEVVGAALPDNTHTVSVRVR
jgi:hypothetical protein